MHPLAIIRRITPTTPTHLQMKRSSYTTSHSCNTAFIVYKSAQKSLTPVLLISPMNSRNRHLGGAV
jgi:hypothetical protein